MIPRRRPGAVPTTALLLAVAAGAHAQQLAHVPEFTDTGAYLQTITVPDGSLLRRTRLGEAYATTVERIMVAAQTARTAEPPLRDARPARVFVALRTWSEDSCPPASDPEQRCLAEFTGDATPVFRLGRPGAPAFVTSDAQYVFFVGQDEDGRPALTRGTIAADAITSPARILVEDLANIAPSKRGTLDVQVLPAGGQEFVAVVTVREPRPLPQPPTRIVLVATGTEPFTALWQRDLPSTSGQPLFLGPEDPAPVVSADGLWLVLAARGRGLRHQRVVRVALDRDAPLDPHIGVAVADVPIRTLTLTPSASRLLVLPSLPATRLLAYALPGDTPAGVVPFQLGDPLFRIDSTALRDALFVQQPNEPACGDDERVFGLGDTGRVVVPPGVNRRGQSALLLTVDPDAAALSAQAVATPAASIAPATAPPSGVQLCHGRVQDCGSVSTATASLGSRCRPIPPACSESSNCVDRDVCRVAACTAPVCTYAEATGLARFTCALPECPESRGAAPADESRCERLTRTTACDIDAAVSEAAPRLLAGGPGAQRAWRRLDRVLQRGLSRALALKSTREPGQPESAGERLCTDRLVGRQIALLLRLRAAREELP